MDAIITESRKAFYKALVNVLLIDTAGVPSNADKDNPLSVRIASGIAKLIEAESRGTRLAAQASGSKFEEICLTFLTNTFLRLKHLRPGQWKIARVPGRSRLALASYEQYSHLTAIAEATKNNRQLAAALGSDYLIAPDIVISREPEEDAVINEPGQLVDDKSVKLSALRKSNKCLPTLHASISCKWTIRSDRVQNARSEALNLIGNRKGRLPHVVVIIGEPLPSRIASIALGTGNIDCVYHFALDELNETVHKLKNEEGTKETLQTMIEGKRLKDISDLPLDLAL
ncbi:MAG: NgoMIV family type II restriction endonuclease [Nitrospira sp.]|nr:NgoMIV family type II restriction endonuclease [Nitrospira sp.]